MKNKSKLKNCKICGQEFIAKPPQKKFCSEECQEKGWNQIVDKHRHKSREKENKNKKEGIDYVICQLCGEKVKRIYGNHLKIHHKGITSAQYKKMFPDTKLSSEKDKHNISVNSGKFMKEDKWRKWASERIKGDKNPNHKSKTTEQQRKEISPFSKEFYKKRGLTEDDRQKFMKKALENKYII